MSYTSTTRKLEELGVDHDKTVKTWRDKIRDEQEVLTKSVEEQLLSPQPIPIVKKPDLASEYDFSRKRTLFKTQRRSIL